MAEQSFKNHTRFDPMFHFFLVPVFLLNIIITSIWYYKHSLQFAHTGIWFVFMSVMGIVLLLKIRLYGLRNQDRIIRLEERLRLQQLCSAEEWAEVESLKTSQLIALRFASNAELPALARRAVREQLQPKQIKEAIVSWRADHLRV